MGTIAVAITCASATKFVVGIMDIRIIVVILADIAVVIVAIVTVKGEDTHRLIIKRGP